MLLIITNRTSSGQPLFGTPPTFDTSQSYYQQPQQFNTHTIHRPQAQ